MSLHTLVIDIQQKHLENINFFKYPCFILGYSNLFCEYRLENATKEKNILGLKSRGVSTIDS